MTSKHLSALQKPWYKCGMVTSEQIWSVIFSSKFVFLFLLCNVKRTYKQKQKAGAELCQGQVKFSLNNFHINWYSFWSSTQKKRTHTNKNSVISGFNSVMWVNGENIPNDNWLQKPILCSCHYLLDENDWSQKKISREILSESTSSFK